MLTAARSLQAALPSSQRRELVSDDPEEYRNWTYLPGTRPGLALSELTQAHRALCIDLVRPGLSPSGFDCLITVFGLEDAFREWEQTNGTVEFERDYWLRFYGEPSETHPWAWRLSGHHVTIHAAIVGGQASLTPLFLGADPAEVAADVKGPIARYAGARALRAEEDLARKLILSMAPNQRRQAIVDPLAPRDIQTRRDPTVFLAGIPKGIPYTGMDDGQRRTMRLLASVYFDRAATGLAEQAQAEFDADADADNLLFAWAGGTERGQGHYYSIRGSGMLIEYDNVENGANHIHTVWRHRTKDWGHDLLADHYRDSPHA